MPEAAEAPAPRNHASRFGLSAKAVANSAALIFGTKLIWLSFDEVRASGALLYLEVLDYVKRMQQDYRPR